MEIVRALPDFFNEEAVDNLPRDLERHVGWVTLDGETVVGFIVVDRRSPRAAEIL